jgi:hypothetical protein
VEATLRAEQLDLAAWGRLARVIASDLHP